MHDRPPLWGYEALATALLTTFVFTLLLLAAEVVSVITHLVIPPLQRVLRSMGREPPAWSDDLLELADLLEEIVQRSFYGIADRFDASLYAAMRWLWRRLYIDWAIEVTLLIADICSVLPGEAWRWLLGGHNEGATEPDGQRSDHLLTGRGIDDGGGSGDGRQPHS
jgi:hypothetical protein